jgi:hypothetical protein
LDDESRKQIISSGTVPCHDLSKPSVELLEGLNRERSSALIQRPSSIDPTIYPAMAPIRHANGVFKTAPAEALSTIRGYLP